MHQAALLEHSCAIRASTTTPDLILQDYVFECGPPRLDPAHQEVVLTCSCLHHEQESFHIKSRSALTPAGYRAAPINSVDDAADCSPPCAQALCV